MIRRSTIALAAVASLTALAIVFAPASGASSKTETLHFFDKGTSFKLVHADGTVAAPSANLQPAAGDTLTTTSLDYIGNHKRHAKDWSASVLLTCKFISATAEPNCVSDVAFGRSLLVFEGDPGTLTAGTGDYEGATGNVVSDKSIGNTDNADIVVKLTKK